MDWGLDQRFRFFERFKNRAQHILDLFPRVGAVTASLGRGVVASGAPRAHLAALGWPLWAGRPGRTVLLPRGPGALAAVLP